jgi:RNase_H superfamily
MKIERTARKYLAFDIETAKELPGDFSLWRNHRPLGICCAATLAVDGEPKLWHSKTSAGTPAKRMTQADAKQLVDYLRDMTSQGYTILTWNGASFDFDVLAEESASLEHCRACVHDHVDMMFHIVCRLGYPIALEKVAQGLGLPGKADGMSGGEAPKRWAKGEYEKVLAYVAQDVRLALQIAAECERRKQFAWITQRGMPKTEPLPGGWKTVREALKLPLPDTSWMKTPILREDFVAWLTSELEA